MKRLSLLSMLLLATVASAQDLTSNNVVVPGTAYEVVIPAAGKVEGANGTFFRSDVTIANLMNRSITLSARWIPNPGKPADVRQIVLAANEVERFDDFVHDVFRETGIGAVVLTAVTSSGDADTSARFHVGSRIYSPAPAVVGGTTSQSFPAVPMSSIDVTNSSLTVYGLGGQDPLSQFRANVGIVNLDASREQKFVVSIPQTVGAPLTYNVTLPPRTMQQINVSRTGTLPFVRVLNQTEGTQRSNKWIIYGSSLDETTGDAWSELGVM